MFEGVCPGVRKIEGKVRVIQNQKLRDCKSTVVEYTGSMAWHGTPNTWDDT